jgi:hypothetical protein
MLRSRIYRRVAFRPLSDADVLALIPGYHPIYAEVDPELLVLINDKAGNGRLRSWAAFTHTASRICHAIGAARIDKTIARNSTPTCRLTFARACESRFNMSGGTGAPCSSVRGCPSSV